MKTKATKAKPAKKVTAKPAAAAPKAAKAPAKAAAPVAPAPKKACATKKVCATKKPETAKKVVTEAPAAPVAKKKLTRIVAHVDVGWGKQLYIRGEGAGLSWEQGIPMLCENDTEWHWVAETDAGPISFKFLIDDKTWALGENITINAGDVHISEPTF
ncbi:MAG: hypothetical protein ACI4QA_05150 [Candidatus Spyradosoma sp.]